MLLTAFYVVLGSFAAPCQQDGNHIVTCQVNKCETAGLSEICTECRAGGVPVDGFCWPPGSPQAAAAGCTKADGAALDKTATTCEKCGDGYFLFMGGCYKVGQDPGSEICTQAEGGLCTECNTDNGLFKNPATAPKSGNECILCWDTTGADGYTGVANCATCTKSDNSPGAATCTECQAGYYKENNECKQCDPSCLTCTAVGTTACETCKPGTYLKADKSCSNACEGNQYADELTMTCKACSEIHAECTACKYNATVSKPQCTACSGQKMVKTAIDGTTTCVDVSSNCEDADHFKADNDAACVLCSNTTAGSTANDKGIADCKECTKSANGSPPTCSACLDGYFFNSGTSTCTDKCGDNCATCTEANNANRCLTCMPGFFPIDSTDQQGKKCVPCDSTADGGREGCSVCSNTGGFKCTDCKANYRKQSNGDTGDDYTCVKTLRMTLLVVVLLVPVMP